MKPAYLERPSRVLLGYFFVALFFAVELLLPGRSLFRGDTLYVWPVLLEARSQVLSGHWPFWASAFATGTPLLANINAGILYPLQLLCWLLPLKPGYHLFLFVHVWLSFVGMHLFLRRGLGLSWTAAVVGALVYGGSGYARSMWDAHAFMAMPWIPLGLAALLEARRRMRLLIPSAMVAGCWSLMVLGGDFQAACLWVPAALLLAALMPERQVLFRVMAMAIAMGLLMTAAQWVPAWYATTESFRSGGLAYAEAVERSFNPVRVVEFFLPHAFGTRDAWYGTSLAGTGATKLLPWVTSMHVGIVAWLAIYLGVRRLRHPVVIWALVLATVALLLSYGRFLPVFPWWQKLPLIGGFRYPEKYLLWTSLGLATLAAVGASTCSVLLRRARLINARHIVFSRWAMAMLFGAIAASLVVYGAADDTHGLFRWIRETYVDSLLILLLTLVVSIRAWPGRQQVVLVALVMFDLLLPWYAETTTTSLFNPAAPTAVSQVIASSDSPRGRFFRDRVVTRLPLPGYYGMLASSGRRAVYYRESMAENTPRLWGLRTADGRSPIESDPMREFRRAYAAPEAAEAVIATPQLALFCRQAAVEWLMTTPARLHELQGQGIETAPHAVWGPHADVVLARLRDVQEAFLAQPVPEGAPRVKNLWRRRPGVMRIDLEPGASSQLVVSETFSAGWRAEDERGRVLPVGAYNGVFVRVDIPEGVTQVRLAFTPPGWHTGALATVAGLACLGAALFQAFRPRLPRAVKRPALIAATACAVFVVIGGAARDHWSCVSEEGFHVMRGMALASRHDSRMSYEHPPLQNQVCGYVANLAWGDRIRWPDTKAWRVADASLFAVDFASENRDIFIDLVRTSRNGSVLFGLLLCVVGVVWAARSGGALAAWLAAAGLALNPTMLAHGHLATTDMAVAALAVAGTFFAWRGTRAMPWRNLFWALCCFAFAATAHFSGLVWFAVFLFLCVPCIAWQETRPTMLFLVIVGAGLFGLALLVLYGPMPQDVRVPGLTWTGARITAGRFIEGLMVQADRVMTGQRTFFHGELFGAVSAWQMLQAMWLKMPAAWGLAALGGALFVGRRLLRTDVLLPLLPAMFFGVLLLAANRLDLGVRHALPLMALAVIAASIAVARLKQPALRTALALVLALSSVFSVALSHPRLIAYVPAWAGGVERGHEWLVDSNYDWGQDLEELEAQWAALTASNRGEPPSLVYHGFVDPRAIYHLEVGPHSYCGIMEQRAIEAGGRAIAGQWRRQHFASFDGTTVASISALRLGSASVPVHRILEGSRVGTIGTSFAVYHAPGPQATRPP